MTNYYEKELDFTGQTKTHQMAEIIKGIRQEVSQLKAKKEEAQAKMPAIKEALNNLVTDVEIITNDKERKKVLDKKKALQEELNELELFANMNIERYSERKLASHQALGLEAEKEYRAYYNMVSVLVDEARQEMEDKEHELLSHRNSLHPYNSIRTTIDKLAGNERSRIRAEEEKRRQR
ncbi:hypothetical protein LZ578_08285 [Jeotgalibaca sp. MA1X17-3]|uniref:hypothetical protein n=1 Tax=Jeotgalibaca sp. MA1X17-3 TaxID=2908211 RepID=UPI001F3E2A4B|nr:hypothetical protein [Jeotgalibaca sp. MA1X17-3]UJF15004.1 hypothetical protein LZ578_08285 [Jeotgalibaca sp. MA1X17-3]